jgi:hypothetical protein
MQHADLYGAEAAAAGKDQCRSQSSVIGSHGEQLLSYRHAEEFLAGQQIVTKAA